MTTSAHTTPTTTPTTNRLARQQPLGLTLPHSVTIVGVGGVGSWIAVFLALAGVPRLILWDNDTVDAHNLNRLPVGPGALNENKAVALQNHIAALCPNCDIAAMSQLWTPADALAIGYGIDTDAPQAERLAEAARHWIVAATDTWQSRRDIYNHSEEHGLSYLEASAEGEYGGVSATPAEFATEDEAAPGYASVPVHVGPCVLAAALVCYHVLHATIPIDLRMGWTPNNSFDIQCHSMDVIPAMRKQPIAGCKGILLLAI